MASCRYYISIFSSKISTIVNLQYPEKADKTNLSLHRTNECLRTTYFHGMPQVLEFETGNQPVTNSSYVQATIRGYLEYDTNVGILT